MAGLVGRTRTVKARARVWLTFWLLGLSLAVPAQTLELKQARAIVSVQGGTTSTQTVPLPYHWDRLHAGRAGAASFDIAFSLNDAPQVPYGLYVPRLGNAYEIWLNGVLLQRNGDMRNANGADYAKVPRHLVISPGLLHRDNVIRVNIRADVGRRGGLAPLVLGPDDEVMPLYLSDFRWRSIGSFVVLILSLLIGAMAFAFWTTQVDTSTPGVARRDPMYLYAAVAELSWAFSIGNALVENPPLNWIGWGVLTTLSGAVWVCSMTLFCVEVAGWGQRPAARWFRRWLALELAGIVVATFFALQSGYPWALTLSYGVSGVTSIVFAVLFIKRAMQGGTLSHRLIAGALGVNALVGLRDLYAFRLSETYGGNTLLRYSSMLFGLTLIYIVILRFRTASVQLSDLLANMSHRVAQKESELALAYHRTEQLARNQERALERSRILRDMHDGVGSHISTAIRQLESGRATSGEVLHTLHESLDHLKLTIDAMNLPRGDLTALLANLRYRLEPRFKASDIELLWDVDLLEPLVRLDDKAMRHLQFMVFEALSNVLQHARASQLRIELKTTTAGAAQLTFTDNGRGFDPENVNLKGLGSLRERAASIGAHLRITSLPGQTVVDIVLG